jgi:tRNA A37 threonylcarbamoyladenosine synthetase subunit TsaC/SUA5/YrdC
MSIFGDKSLVYLTPTDTTIGFISQDAAQLSRIKERPPNKHYIKAIPSLQKLRSFTRVPLMHHNLIRRAQRTTFIVPDGNSFRIIKHTPHAHLIGKLDWAYTTSANLSGQRYDETFARNEADVVVRFPIKADDKEASKIVRLNNIRAKRIR